MRRRYLWAGLVTVIAITVASSAAAMSNHSQKAQVLRISVGAEPPSLDPGLATDTTSANVLFNLMDPLILLGKAPALKAVPGAASSWSVKGAHVVLNLRHNVRWTNGQPVTAQDYVWSWLRTISPELAADYAYQFDGIKGATAYNGCDPAKADCNALKAKVGIKALGKYKLAITLASPQPWFIQQLSHTSFLPVNKAAVTKWGNKWTEPGHIVTDGPFKLASWKHDASLTLVKNTKWRNASKVKLTRVEMPIIVDGTTAENAFRAGNIDIDDTGVPPVDIPSWKKTKFWKVYKSLGSFRFQSAFSTWLYSIVKNTYLDALKSRAGRERALEEPLTEREVAELHDAVTAEERLLAKESRRTVMRAHEGVDDAMRRTKIEIVRPSNLIPLAMTDNNACVIFWRKTRCHRELMEMVLGPSVGPNSPRLLKAPVFLDEVTLDGVLDRTAIKH